MTTTTNPGNYVDFDEYVGLKLEKTCNTIRTTDFLTASAGVAAMFLGYLLVFVILDQWVVRDGFGVAWRWLLLSTLMISTIAWLVWKIGIPSFRTVNGLFAAKEIENAEPGLKSSLLNLIDLKSAGRTVNPAILKALERRAAVRLQEVDVGHAIDHRPLVRTAYVLLAVIVLFCLYALLSPKKISNSIWRGLLPAAEVPLATRTEILSVKPGDVTIPAHTTSLEIQVDLGGEIPHQVWALYTTADGRFDRQPVELRVEAEGQTRFKGQLIGETSQGLMQDITYVIKAGDAESPPYKVTVEQPPSAEIETVRIEFPPYMKLEPIDQSQNGQIDAWEGAKVVVSAKTNMPVRSGMIQFLDDPQTGPTGEEMSMSVTSGGRHLEGSWTLSLRGDGSFPKFYQIDCKTEDGRRDTAPTNHGLTIRPDLPPEVALLHPERDLDSPANATLPLLIQASDPDFELGYLYLNAEKGGQKILHEILSEGRQPKLVLKHDLVLPKLKLVAGDLIDIWIEAYDNKQPRPNTRNSPKIRIRLLDPVTKKEAEQQLAEQNERREEKLAEAERETNPNSADQPLQPEDESKNRDSENNTRPNESEQTQERDADASQPKDAQSGTSESKPGDQKEPASGQGKGTEKSQGGKSRDEKDPRSTDASKDDAGTPDSKNTPLNSDGSQDDEAIKRLNEKLNRDTKKKDGPPEDNPSSDSKDQESRDNTAAKDEPKSASDKNHSNEEPSQDEPGPKGSKPDLKEPHEKEASEKNSSTQDETSSDPEKSKAENKDATTENPDPAGTEKPKPEPGKNTKNGGKKEKSEPSDKGESTDAPKKDLTNDANENGTDPQEVTDPPKKKDATGDQKDPQTNPGQGDPDKKNEGDKTPSDPDKNNAKNRTESEESDDLPSGLNEKTTKPKSSQNSDNANSSQEKTESDSANDGPGEQAPESENATKKPADGTEKGIAKPDRDPGSKPKTVKNDDVKRDPGEKPETRPGDTPAGDKKQTEQRPPRKDPKPTGDAQQKDARQKDVAPKERSAESDPPSNDTKQETQKKDRDSGRPQLDSKTEKQKQNPGAEADDRRMDNDAADDATQQKNSDSKAKKTPSTEDKDPAGGDSDSDANTEKAPGDSAGTKSKDESGSGENPSDGGDQKSAPDKNSGGDQATDNAASPSGDKPKGDKGKSDKPGGDKPGGEKPGGDKKSESGPQDSKSSAEKSSSGKGGEGKGDGKGQGKGKSGDKASAGKPSSASSGSSKLGQTSGQSEGGGGPVAEGDTPSSGTGEGATVEDGEDANLEYNRQATELILQKLKKELDRGEVDPELLEQLGWNQDEMKRFADRLAKSLEESKRAEESPDAKARQQQFQEMLKNLDLQKSGTQRSGEKEPKRDILQIESKRMPIPPAYRSAYEKFTRDLAKQKQKSN